MLTKDQCPHCSLVPVIQGVGDSFKLQLVKLGGWCLLLIGARESRELVLHYGG